MSARDVADMLALAHAGHQQAEQSGDARLQLDCEQLALRALAHPDAGTFFAGLQVALAETYDDDPVDDLGVPPDEEDVRDGTATTEAPVDAGAIPHDERVRREDLDHAERLEPDQEHASTGVNDIMRRAAANLRVARVPRR